MKKSIWQSALTTLSLTFILAACGPESETAAPVEAASQPTAAETQAIADAARASGLIELANDYLAKGRFVSARQQAEKALEANPQDADAYAVLGASQWRAGLYEESTAAFRKAIEFDPTNFGAAQGLGRNLQAAGLHAETIKLQDSIIATEKSDEESQAAPRMTKLWSQYAILDVENGVKAANEALNSAGITDGQREIVLAYATFLRALEGKGPFNQVSGADGITDFNITALVGLKNVGVAIGAEQPRALVLEHLLETRIDKSLVAAAGLKPLAGVEVQLFGTADKSQIVLIPEVTIGGVSVKNVPAVVQDLGASFGESIGSVPGLVLGRQFMQSFGAITFDYTGRIATFAKEAAAPTGASALQLLFLNLYSYTVPAIPVGIDNHSQRFWMWFGVAGSPSLTMNRAAYLKSNHLQRELDAPDDPEQGLKMVFVDQLNVGDVTSDGIGGVIFTKADPTVSSITAGSFFELSGMLNFPSMMNWRVTYSLPQGKVYVQGPT